ncbi:MAG: TlpA family protein disulfide reductase [Planctomycetes bacterium]|nr:TlpA family protein disulfide reductase [Planctomycetota bacterium]MCB9919543.1 TlpA family protein disulfide reductase [Planctomycetota bacterium]
MPELQTLYRRLQGQGLALIAVHTKSASERMAAWMKDNDISVPVCIDSEGTTVQTYGVDSYPDYYVIDRSGKLRVADLANADVERTVTALLAEPVPADHVAKTKNVDTQPESSDAALLFETARETATKTKRRIFAYPTADW